MDFYLALKTFHIIAFCSWMALLFYLPRLFVYHAEHAENKGFCEVVKIQERKLYKFIGYPALFGTFASGAALLALNPSLLSGAGFMHAKLLLVVLLAAYHFSLGYFLRRFAEDKNTKSGKFFRAYNEAPTIALILIVILIIIRPF